MKRLLGFASIGLMVAAIISSSCSFSIHPHPDSTYTPKAANDGVAVYGEVVDGVSYIYAQRISAEGYSMWGDKGVLLESGQTGASSPPVSEIMTEIIAWPDLSASSDETTWHLGRLSDSGHMLWQLDLPAFDQFVDGFVAAIIVYDHPATTDASDADAPFVVTMIDREGKYVWGYKEATIPRHGYVPGTLRVVGTGYGSGAVAVWEERVSEPGSSRSYQRIMAQRINDTGLPAWESPIIVATSREGVSIEELALTNWSINPSATVDPADGVIVAWHQVPLGKVTRGTPQWYQQDIFVQRIDADGNLTWQAGGVPLNIVRTAENAQPHTPIPVSDYNGGAVVLWEDLRNGLASIYAQRINGDGKSMWMEGGMKVLYVKNGESLSWRQAITDTYGGAVVSCASSIGILVQRIDSSGRTLWAEGGVVITSASTTNHYLSQASYLSQAIRGGAVVAWGTSDGQRSFVQQIDEDGKLTWGESGIELGVKGIPPPPSDIVTPAPPWPGIPAYMDSSQTINVKVGDEFVVGMDVRGDMFPIFKELYESNTVTLIEQKYIHYDEKGVPYKGEEAALEPNHVTWYLFKAIQPGKTQITLQYYGHLAEGLKEQNVFDVVIG
jgi:hypothetical protein